MSVESIWDQNKTFVPTKNFEYRVVSSIVLRNRKILSIPLFRYEILLKIKGQYFKFFLRHLPPITAGGLFSDHLGKIDSNFKFLTIISRLRRLP